MPSPCGTGEQIETHNRLVASASQGFVLRVSRSYLAPYTALLVIASLALPIRLFTNSEKVISDNHEAFAQAAQESTTRYVSTLEQEKEP